MLICGVQSPSMGRRAPPLGTEGSESYAAAQGAPSQPATAPEPTALESKTFCEMRALNRCVFGLTAAQKDRQTGTESSKSCVAAQGVPSQPATAPRATALESKTLCEMRALNRGVSSQMWRYLDT